MTVQINYKNGGLKNIIGNHVLFVGEKFNIKPLIKHISEKEFSFVNDLLKTGDLKKNILTFDINSKKKIILVNIKDKSSSSDVENLGAELYDFIKINKITNLAINSNSLKAKP